jgi:maleylpyruvate isomerase
MQLHGFWRSTATWRVRIALAHKGLAYSYQPVDLVAGDQHDPAYREISPMSQVPVLELPDGARISQSIAILEYLEETHPDPPLLPRGALARARVREFTEVINAGIQPLQNTAVRLHLEQTQGVDIPGWIDRFVGRGIAALEALAARSAGRFVVGDALSFADVLLVPQLYFARRFDLDLAACPTLLRVEAACAALACFQVAHAERQPDYPPGA